MDTEDEKLAKTLQEASDNGTLLDHVPFETIEELREHERMSLEYERKKVLAWYEKRKQEVRNLEIEEVFDLLGWDKSELVERTSGEQEKEREENQRN